MDIKENGDNTNDSTTDTALADRGAGYSWNYICQVDTNVSTTN